MDSDILYNIVNKLPTLKYKFCGVFSPASLPPLHSVPLESFLITNTVDGDGEHWVSITRLAARSSDKNTSVLYFGDSMGEQFYNYPALAQSMKNDYCCKIVPVLHYPIQESKYTCGFHAT